MSSDEQSYWRLFVQRSSGDASDDEAVLFYLRCFCADRLAVVFEIALNDSRGKGGKGTGQGFCPDCRRPLIIVEKQFSYVPLHTRAGVPKHFIGKIPDGLSRFPLPGFRMEAGHSDDEEILADRFDAVLPALVVLECLTLPKQGVEHGTGEPSTGPLDKPES